MAAFCAFACTWPIHLCGQREPISGAIDGLLNHAELTPELERAAPTGWCTDRWDGGDLGGRFCRLADFVPCCMGLPHDHPCMPESVAKVIRRILVDAAIFPQDSFKLIENLVVEQEGSILEDYVDAFDAFEFSLLVLALELHHAVNIW